MISILRRTSVVLIFGFVALSAALLWPALAPHAEAASSGNSENGTDRNPGPPIDLSLRKSVDWATAGYGSRVTFTIVIANKGTSTRTATGIAVGDTPDAGLVLVSADAPPGTSLDPQSNAWLIPQLQKGDSLSLKLVFEVRAFGILNNCAEVVYANEHDDDSTPGNADVKHEDDDDCASVSVPTEEAMCYLVADNDGFLDSDDAITAIDKNNLESLVGMTGTKHTEAIAFDPETGILYGSNADRFGSISLATGAFSEIGSFGSGDGSLGTLNFADVDGLSIDPFSGILYASIRRSGLDLLIQVDRATGMAVADAFGPGATYVAVPSINNLDDIDDIAVSSVDGTLYAILNENGKSSRLITIDKLTGLSSDVTDLDVENVEGLGFHPDGRFLGVLGNGHRQLVEINPSDGSTDVLVDLGISDFRDYEGVACLTESRNIILGSVNLKGVIDLELTKTAIGPSSENAASYEITVLNNATLHSLRPNPPYGVAAAGVTVELYQDVNVNGEVDPGEPLLASTITATDGTYQFEISATNAFVMQVDLSTVTGLAAVPLDNVEEAVFSGFGEVDGGNDFFFHVFTDATGIAVRDVLPNGIQFTDATPSQGVYDPTLGVWSVGRLAPGAAAVLSMNVTATAAGTYRNCAEVEAVGEYDLDSMIGNGLDNGEDDYSCATFVVPPPEHGGSIGDLVFEDLNGNGLHDTGEPGLPGVLIRLHAGLCGPAGTPVAVRVASQSGAYLFDGLPAGAYCVDVLDSSVPFGYFLTTANDPISVTLGSGEHFLEADFGYQTNPEFFEADLELTKTVTTSSPAINDIVTFTITLSNKGPANATNVIVRDVIPVGLVYVDATPSQGYFDTRNGFWGVGTLPVYESVVLSIRVRVVIQNMIENIAQVIAVDQEDPDSTPGNGVPTEDDQDNAIVEARGPGSSGDILRVECADVGTINALAFDPTRNILLAGSEAGRLHVSTDEGLNWPFFLETETRTPIRDIIVGASGNAYAASLGDGAYRSSDGGTTWADIGPVSGSLEDLDIDDASGTVYAAGDGAVLAFNGSAWSEIGTASNPFAGRQVVAVVFDAATGTVFASTFGQGVYHFVAGAWSPASTGLPVGGVNVLFRGPSNEILAGTNNDGVFVYTDGSWTRFGTGLESEPIESLGAGPSGELVAGARESAAYYYEPLSGAWLSVGNLPIYTVTSITVDGMHRIFAGAPGEGIYMIFDSDSNGIPDLSYQMANYLTTAVIQDLVVAPDGGLFAATYGYGILYSNDGGKCWTRMNRGLENLWTYAIVRQPSGPLFIGIWADGLGGIWRSDDDGRNWELVAFPDRQIVSLAIDPTNEDVIYAGVNLSGTGSIYRSMDGGHTWVVLESFTQPVWSIAVSPADPNRLVIGTLGNGIWESVDGGVSFDQTGSVLSGLANDSVFEVAFAPAGSPFSGEPYAGTGAGVYRYDGFSGSWVPFGSGSETYEIRTLAFAGSQLFAGTWNSGIIEYNTGTGVWEDFGLADVPVVAFAVHYDSETLVIGTAGQGLFLAPHFAISTDVESFSKQRERPTTIGLLPNYPNPFNPTTTIPFEIEHLSHIRIAIFDLLGREVALLVDESVSPGRYEVVWEAGDRPSGTYMVRMVVDGAVQSRTVSLLK